MLKLYVGIEHMYTKAHNLFCSFVTSPWNEMTYNNFVEEGDHVQQVLYSTIKSGYIFLPPKLVKMVYIPPPPLELYDIIPVLTNFECK